MSSGNESDSDDLPLSFDKQQRLNFVDILEENITTPSSQNLEKTSISKSLSTLTSNTASSSSSNLLFRSDADTTSNSNKFKDISELLFNWNLPQMTDRFIGNNICKYTFHFFIVIMVLINCYRK